MQPVIVDSTNGVLKAPQGQEDTVFDLPVRLTGHGDCMEVASCWQMTWRERWRALWTGQVWFHCRGHTHPPIKLTIE